MFSILLLAAAVTAADTPAEVGRFEQALSEYRFDEARSVLNKLIEARTPADGKPHPDPLIDALVGQLYLASTNTEGAVVYLNKASLADLPASIRPTVALDKAAALERTGHRAGALAAFREAGGVAGTDLQRRQAELGIARQVLVESPGIARSTVAEIANGAPSAQRWEAKAISAQAASLSGDPASASRLADEAWADAINAPIADLSALRAATLRAGLAAARHDSITERAMLTTTNGLSLSASGALSAELPICGDNGLRPADYVIFGYVSGPYLERQLFPIAASRIEAVRPFYDALSGFVPVNEAFDRKPLGTVLTVSCRTSVHPSYVANHFDGDPLFRWFVQHNYYPGWLTGDSTDDQLNALDARVDALTTRFGKNSPLLLVPTWETLNILLARATAGDDVLPGQIVELSNQLANGLRAAGAPEWLASSTEARAALLQAYASGGTPEQQMAIYEAQARSQLAQAPLTAARQDLLQIDHEIGGKDHDGRATSLLDRLTVSLKDKPMTDLNPRERQAWLMTVAEAQKKLGQDQAARATLTSAKLDKGSCLITDSDVELLEQHFTYKQYPQELIVGQQEGVTAFDFNVTPTGAIGAHHILYSLPSGLFDELSEKGLSTVRYTLPKLNGKPAGCSGNVQPIVWRLEDQQHEFAPPTFIPHAPGDVT
jgi:hypothetical protein